MHVDATKLLFLTFIQDAAGKLLQINKWHEIPMEPGELATLDLNLFMSCERFSMLFASKDDELNRLKFIFDGEDLQKVDVDSPPYVEIPSPPPVFGGCREVDKKSLRIHLISRAKKLEVRLHEQVIIRPKRNSSNVVKILFPQKGACCMVRAILLKDGNALNFTLAPRKKQRPMKIRTESTVDHRLITDARIQPTPKPTTSVHEYQLISWTDVVNREWSTSFLVCSISILIVMIAMITFGFCTFIYLQTRPNSGKKIYTIED
ncbi:hypothetical protein RB195_017847 [Necator americanus]|uniref:Uncharacterized protein n=1 Tax=Necator americanus TaxID=51031 RepID=A0ABR1C745_NECAM